MRSADVDGPAPHVQPNEGALTVDVAGLSSDVSGPSVSVDAALYERGLGSEEEPNDEEDVEGGEEEELNDDEDVEDGEEEEYYEESSQVSESCDDSALGEDESVDEANEPTGGMLP